jgi:transposase
MIQGAGWAGGQHPMVRPISNDLRKRVVAAVAKGESCRSVASRFGVAVSSVVKWSQRHRATGSVAPGKMGGHRKPVLEPHRAFIRERISPTCAESTVAINAINYLDKKSSLHFL